MRARFFGRNAKEGIVAGHSPTLLDFLQQAAVSLDHQDGEARAPLSNPGRSTQSYDRASPGRKGRSEAKLSLYNASSGISADTIADVVFVHGLRGDSRNAWFHEKSQVYWATVFLRDDINNARVLSFGYDTDIINCW